MKVSHYKPEKNDMKIINSQINLTLFPMVFFLLLLPVSQAWSETRYVTDNLTVPMRSGTTSQHRIIKFLKSGMAVEVIEPSEDGNYMKVSTPGGREGWVEVALLVNQRSARDRIVDVSTRLKKSQDKAAELRQTIAGLNSKNNDLDRELKDAQREIKALQSKLANLKRVAANPVALANKNRALEQELNQVASANTVLTEENTQLADTSTKEWFVIGAVVSLGSLLFGLLITRINWKRKRDSWGDL